MLFKNKQLLNNGAELSIYTTFCDELLLNEHDSNIGFELFVMATAALEPPFV